MIRCQDEAFSVGIMVDVDPLVSDVMSIKETPGAPAISTPIGCVNDDDFSRHS